MRGYSGEMSTNEHAIGMNMKNKIVLDVHHVRALWTHSGFSTLHLNWGCVPPVSDLPFLPTI